MCRNGNTQFFKNGRKMTGESGTLTFPAGETRKFLALPPRRFIDFTALEIIGAPFSLWWQARLSR
jgi:hypothetical protein